MESLFSTKFCFIPSNLSSINNLIISSNDALNNIDGLSNLSNINQADGAIIIDDNDVLTNINGLSNLNSSSINQIFISENNALTNIDVLSNFTTIHTYLIIEGNNALSNIDGLLNISTVGLASYNHTGNMISIRNNPALTNIDGLNGLNYIYSSLIIENNDVLTNLDGLLNLHQIGDYYYEGGLGLINNNALTNIDGLSNLTIINGELGILDNITLFEFCGLYNLLNNNGLNGFYNVSGNAVNPTEQEIIDGGPCSAPVIATFYLTTGTDDIMYYNGSANATISRFGESGNIYRGIEQIYKNVTILQGTEITSAILEVKANTSTSGTVVADIYSDLRDNPFSVMSFAQYNGNINFSSVSEQYVAPPFAAGNLYQIDITEVIQDRVNNPNWTEGDNLGIIVKGNTNLSSGYYREITRAENSLTDNKLIITYNSGLGKFASGNKAEIIPENYELFQNYPNPFNPSTSIEYQIPQDGFVSLIVYDILGREVITLVNEMKRPGNYTVTFDASDLASGIYIYRLQTNDFVSSKKMLLLK